MRHLCDLLQPERLTSVVDVGGNPIDGSPPYARMMEEGLCAVTVFDPQMSNAPRQDVTYIPKVIGTASSATLHVCAAPGMSSLLPPSPVAMGRFPGFAEWGAVVDRRTVDVVSLDDADEVSHIDLLCMDVQGSELDVLISGRRKLRRAAAIITEVSFMPLYRGQWTFANTDETLRGRGFVPHCFAAAKVWPVATKTPVPNIDPHQLLEADMVYVRDTCQPVDVETLKHMALIAHHVCGSFDLAMLCVENLSDRGALPQAAPSQYRQMLEAL